MNLLGNIIWLIFGGFFTALAYFILGIIFCLTIIGIPFGLQLFKLSEFTLTPFGCKTAQSTSSYGVITLFFNIIWIIFAGIELTLLHLALGLLLCLTIAGIPFGMQHFKLIPLALMPFGREIVKDN